MIIIYFWSAAIARNRRKYPRLVVLVVPTPSSAKLLQLPHRPGGE